MAYFSNLLTATKTRYASLRQGDDADGDTEDDSHITRVLRNYYLEQQPHRPYPEWLPPPTNLRSGSPATSLRSSYGRRQGQPPQGQQPQSLSDIWDAPAEQRPPIGRNASSGSARPPAHHHHDEAAAPPTPTASAGSNLTAQQRIKERLWGSRGSASGPSPPPQQANQPLPHGRVEMPLGGLPPGRLEMPMGPPRRGGNGGASSGQPYMGAGMPWDDGYGGEFEVPAIGYNGGGGGGNMRRGVGGRPPYR